jgi:hypothetical protein
MLFISVMSVMVITRWTGRSRLMAFIAALPSPRVTFRTARRVLDRASRLAWTVRAFRRNAGYGRRRHLFPHFRLTPNGFHGGL